MAYKTALTIVPLTLATVAGNSLCGYEQDAPVRQFDSSTLRGTQVDKGCAIVVYSGDKSKLTAVYKPFTERELIRVASFEQETQGDYHNIGEWLANPTASGFKPAEQTLAPEYLSLNNGLFPCPEEYQNQGHQNNGSMLRTASLNRLLSNDLEGRVSSKPSNYSENTARSVVKSLR